MDGAYNIPRLTRVKALYSLLLCFALTSVAMAQRDVNNWQVSGHYGTVTLSENLDLPDGFNSQAAGIRIERNLGKSWALGLQVLQLEMGADAERFTYSGLALAYFWDNGYLLSDRAALAPFHRLQIGYGHEAGTSEFFGRQGNTFGFENGVKIRLGDRFSADLALEILAPREKFITSHFFSQTNYAIWKVGVSYHFGAKESTFQGPVFRAGSAQDSRAYRTDIVFGAAEDTGAVPRDSLLVLEMIPTEDVDSLPSHTGSRTKVDSLDFKSAFSQSDSTQAATGEARATGSKSSEPDTENIEPKSGETEITSQNSDTNTTNGSNSTQNKTTRNETVQRSATAGAASQSSEAPPGQAQQGAQTTSFSAGNEASAATSVPEPRSTANNTTILPPSVITNTRQVQDSTLVKLNERLAAQNALLLAGAVAATGVTASGENANSAREDSLAAAIKELQEKYDFLLLFLAQNKLDTVFSEVSSDWRNPIGGASDSTAQTQSDSRSALGDTLALPADTISFPTDTNAVAAGLITLPADTLFRSIDTIQVAVKPPAAIIADSTATAPIQQPRQAPVVTSDISRKGKYPMVVNFALNRTNVDAAYLPNLERIGQDLAQQDGLRIALKAYSDKSGKAEYNQIISEKRAQSVLEIIAGQGARQHQIDLEILGASQATDRYSPDARRVEVILAKP